MGNEGHAYRLNQEIPCRQICPRCRKSKSRKEMHPIRISINFGDTLLAKVFICTRCRKDMSREEIFPRGLNNNGRD